MAIMKFRRRSVSTSSGGGAGSGGSGGATIFDRLLVPRVRNYSASHSLEDVDEVASSLRTLHREYQRQKMGPFRMQVARAVAVVQQQQDEDEDEKPEALIQVILKFGG